MPIPHEFDYIKPKTISEVTDLLTKYGKNSKILAGGTDLANMLKMGFPVPEMMIDIKGIPALEVIELKGNTLFIGSGVTFASIIQSELLKQKFNILWEAAHYVASNGVRNRATMVGNICSAVACMDSGAPLLVHDAVIHAISSTGERKIPVQQWFIDNRKTDIKENEFVTGISIEIPNQKYAGAYQKQMRYAGEDLAQSNVGVLAFEDKTFRVAFGSVAPTPKRSLKIENLINNKEITPELIAETKKMIETVIAPITDVRSTKEYRVQMVKVMFERALLTAIERLKSK